MAREPGDSHAMDFEIRAAVPSDEAELVRLARHLNTVNLPADNAAVARLLDVSERSFAGTLSPQTHRKYLFVLRDLKRGELVGTSSIVAQLGRRDAPYIYLSVLSEEKYSRDLNLHFDHLALQIGFSYDGPTELAGLVVDPSYRRHPGRLGLCISYVRFLYIAARRHLFREQLLAELLPPLEPDGTSHLWNALGRRFTNMTYREADRLSHENKDFIRDLFPSGVVYASLLSHEARDVIGKVGAQTKGVEKMLTRVGFEYANRVDPFDGGPHFVAKTSEVSVIERHVRLPVRVVSPLEGAKATLVATLSDQPPYCHASMCPAVWGDALGVEPAVARQLSLTDGQLVDAVPVP